MPGRERRREGRDDQVARSFCDRLESYPRRLMTIIGSIERILSGIALCP
jgi:hypothetical protein